MAVFGARARPELLPTTHAAHRTCDVQLRGAGEPDVSRPVVSHLPRPNSPQANLEPSA